MPTYATYTKFTTAVDDRPALVKLLMRAAESMRAVPECHLYVVNVDASDLSVVWVTELWTDKAAHDASLTHTDARALIQEALPLLLDRPEQVTLDPVGGKLG